MSETAPTIVIAEAGVNHNGSVETALQLVDAAAEAGADIVKFQTFVPEEVISDRAPKAAYQQQTTGVTESQLDMVRKLCLPNDAFHDLAERCQQKEIAFLSTPFDLPSLRFLTEDMGLATLKLPSGEITNAPLLLAAARSGKRLILSTGMATLGEVEEALGVLAFGYTVPDRPPSVAAFRTAFASPEGRGALAAHVTLLHCTTEYPAPFAEVNLRAMATLNAAFGLPVGLSDHTPGIAAPTAAVALGARMIEKHFTLDHTLPGPDHKASLEPGELASMIVAIRQVEEAMGDGVKVPGPSEIPNMPIVRKSLVAGRAIAKGERFDAENLKVKRPGSGISPMEYWEWIGRAAGRDYEADEPIAG